jgi:tetratricopeptide (TPR) repeat protein
VKELGLGFRRSLALSILVFVGLFVAQAALSEPFLGDQGRTVSGEAGLQPATDAAVLNDPWLAEDGPAVAKPVEVAEEQVIAAWRGAPVTAHARASALLRTRLELGLGDLPGPAAVISTEESPEEPALYTGLAHELAPGFPSFQIDHAVALWRAGDIGAAIGALGSVFWAVTVSLAAQLWLLENFALLLLATVVSAALAFVLLAAIQVFPHAAHDFGDLMSGNTPAFARFAALSALVLAPSLFGEGLLGLALALFTLGFLYGGRRQRNALIMAAVLLVIGLHPLAQLASVATRLVDRDPVAHSVMAVLAGNQSASDIELLESASVEDLAAEHALAYHARRTGLEELSRERMASIASRFPSDAVALANLGNIEKRRGNNDAAIEFYERAAAQMSSPTLLFDLSQAYAADFRMDDYEATLVRGQHLGDQEVAALSALGDAELVADLEYPVALLRDRLLTLALSQRTEASALAALAPGRLGEAWYVTAGAFLLVALLSMLLSSRWDHSSQCGRCGHRICTRCEDTVWSDEICEDCHHLFQNPEATDPSLRMARLQALSERESRFDKIWLTLAILIPGTAGFAARRPDLAILGLLLFSWVACWIAWPKGVLADPMLMGGAAVLTFAIPGLLAAFAYTGVVLISLILRKSR